MPSEQSGPSPKKSANGSAAPKNLNGGQQGSNKQIRDFQPPQPQRERRPSREDVEKVAGLINGDKPAPKDGTSSEPHSGRSREARGDVPPGQSSGLPDSGRSDRRSEEQTRREPESSNIFEDDRPFLQLDEDEDGKPLKRTPKARSLLDLADEGGIKYKDLYEMTIPMDEGEAPISIGQMKDRIREVRNFEFERDEWADYRESAMNEIVESRTQIDGVLQSLKQVVPADQLARAFADQIERYNGQVARAKEQIREYFPEWDDHDRKQADRKKLKEALASYGFSSHEVDNVVDARLIRFAMHAIRLMDRYKRAKESMRERTPSTSGPSRQKQPVPNRQQQAKSMADGGDKVGAVAKLLG